jgi:hypothetical protein
MTAESPEQQMLRVAQMSALKSELAIIGDEQGFLHQEKANRSASGGKFSRPQYFRFVVVVRLTLTGACSLIAHRLPG